MRLHVVWLLQLCTLLQQALHVKGQSAGCAKVPHQTGGQSIIQPLTYDGTEYQHQLSIPASYKHDVPVPLMFFFHGWMDKSGYRSCGSFCTRAVGHGFMTASMTGMGDTAPTWNGAGSARSRSSGPNGHDMGSPGRDGSTCTKETQDYCFKSSCNECADNCWYTTCKDSVGQVLQLLHSIEENFCINTSMVWATGCSNGGTFVHELAWDKRSSSRFAGIVPIIGLPHNGFNYGPSSPMSYLGIFGSMDTYVPPLSNTDDPTKSYDTLTGPPQGWYYSTSRNTSDLWGNVLKCTGRAKVVNFWGIEPYSQLNNCTQMASCSGGTEVVECLFTGGHWCSFEYQHETALNFMLTHPLHPSTTTTTTSQTTTTTLTQTSTSSGHDEGDASSARTGVTVSVGVCTVISLAAEITRLVALS